MFIDILYNLNERLNRINFKQIMKSIVNTLIVLFLSLMFIGIVAEVVVDNDTSSIFRFLNDTLFSHIFMFTSFPYGFLVVAIALLSLAVHERSHAIVAYKLGDRSLKAQGRLSKNPFKHIHPLGAVMFMIFGFGWARPIIIDSDKFEDPKSATAIIAAAGPLSNIALVIVSAIVMQVMIHFNIYPPMIVAQSLFIFFWLNIVITILNSLPLIPFDGSKVLMILIPDKLYEKLINSYSLLITSICSAVVVFALLFSGIFSDSVVKMLWANETYLRYDCWVDKSSAISGDIQAQNYLGNNYYYGFNEEQNYEQAVYWYRKSAEGGNEWAQYNLGHMYNNGYGVTKDYEMAVFWYTEAANQGNKSAIDALNTLLCVDWRYDEILYNQDK